MPQNIPVVIIDSDADMAGRMTGYIKRLGDHVTVEGVAATFENGFELIYRKRPMVVILEAGPSAERLLERMAAILDRFPQMSIFVTSADSSADTILKVMRAGAAEYLLRPVLEVDLESALQKVGRLYITKPSVEAARGRIFTFFSPKGGVGVTTVATNLARDISTAADRPTLLVDLDLNAGDVTTFLNMKTSYTISDVTANISRLDESFLKGVIAKHESGVYVLSEPQKVEDAFNIPGGDVRKLLRLLRGMFGSIVIDAGSVLNERSMAAIEMADVIVMVFVMSLPCIRHIQRHLRYFEDMGLGKDRIRLVVNRYIKKGDIGISDAEKVLNHPVFWSIPNDYDSAMAALNKGVPIGMYRPRSPLSLSIEDLAKEIVKL
ncbi:MAG: AAA family ATPase [Deltaproteobacteria bacterium]|nr:AAA family ATPase [Deltaproteobacteria bacterium]